VPVTVGLTFSHTVLAFPKAPLYERLMLETFTFWHGTPLLQIILRASGVAEVPLMSSMFKLLILILEGI
jgi:hypothetical protein